MRAKCKFEIEVLEEGFQLIDDCILNSFIVQSDRDIIITAHNYSKVKQQHIEKFFSN